MTHDPDSNITMPFDADYRPEIWQPTAYLKFVKNQDGHRILHQLWRDANSFATEWRQVEEEDAA